MRVFYLVGTLKLGGSENQMVEMARRLKSAGYHVTAGYLGAEGPFIEHLRRARVPVVRFPVQGSLLRPGSLWQIVRLARFLRREKFGIVHTHDLWSNLFGVAGAWLARVPVIISSRRDLAHFWWYTPRRRRILRRIQNLGTFVVANSEAVRNFLVNEDGFRREKIRVVRNAVDFERFSNARGQREELLPGVRREHKIVVLIGNMNLPVKGHSYLIKAAERICPALPGTRFVLVGDGRQRPRLERQVREAGLQKNFIFLGHRNDVAELLSVCDLFVLPSTAEGLPNAILEAQAAGLPVVASAVGGIPELIEDEKSGLLVPPRDPEALAEAILRVLQDPRLAKSLAQAGQERARTSFSFDRLLLETKQLYEDARGQARVSQKRLERNKRAGCRSPIREIVGPEAGVGCIADSERRREDY